METTLTSMHHLNPNINPKVYECCIKKMESKFQYNLRLRKLCLEYYEGLMGKSDSNLIHIDVAAMRNNDQLSMKQKHSLIAPISEQEILKALNGIGDMKAPGIDGYGARFFKASWQTIKGDMIATIMNFFENERLYKAFNITMVTLIPKSDEATSIKDFRPIARCTILYKIISKVLTARLGKVLGNIISPCQVAFIHGQQIYNHILLAYELMKGYTRKGGTPKCMIHLDLQKAYDMVDWRALEGILKEIGMPNQFIRWTMKLIPK